LYAETKSTAAITLPHMGSELSAQNKISESFTASSMGYYAESIHFPIPSGW
jgi:hypothetical protein